jgi:transglutaminase-like putative cysteine protease
MKLTPSEHAGLRVIEWSIESDKTTFGEMFTDGAGNHVQTLYARDERNSVEIAVRGIVETTDTGGVLQNHREKIHPTAYLQKTHTTLANASIQELTRETVDTISESKVLDRVHRLARRASEVILYKYASTTVTTTAAQALESGQGVCQDYAHLLIATCGVIGLPARYVSGYLLASDNLSPHELTHAWAEVFIPDLGWVGFDPANRCCPDDNYIRLASGLDANQAAPIRGRSHGKSQEILDVDVAVKSMQQ